MPQMNSSADFEEMALKAVVIRCGCGQPEAHPGTPCPRGIAVDLGTISYYNKNPWIRLKFHWAVWRKRLLREQGPLLFSAQGAK